METQFLRIEVVEASNTFWDWREWIGCDIDDFDDTVVISSNRLLANYKNAKWYRDAKLLIAEIDYKVGIGNRVYLPQIYTGFHCSEELFYQLYDEYENNEFGNDIEGVYYVACLVNPKLNLKFGTIRGYVQSEWQNVIYDADKTTLEQIENGYFQKMYRLDCEEIGLSTYVSHDELWRAEMHKGGVENLVRETLEISDGYEIEVYRWDSNICDFEFVC